MKRLIGLLLILPSWVLHSMEPEEVTTEVPEALKLETLAQRYLKGKEGELPGPLPSHLESTIVEEILSKGPKQIILSHVALSFEDGDYRSLYSYQSIPTDRKTVSGSGDGTAKIFDPKTKAFILILRGHTAAFLSSAFNRAGDKIVTCSEDTTARIWDIETGASLSILRGHTGAVESAEFNQAGTKVVTNSKDGTVKIWDIQTSTCLHSFPGQRGKFSPESDKVVTTSEDGTVKIWDIQTGKLLHCLTYSFRGLTVQLKSAQFNPAGDKVVTGSEDGFTEIWEVKTGELIRSLECSSKYILEGSAIPVELAEFSPAGDRVAALSSERMIFPVMVRIRVRIWNIGPLLSRENFLKRTITLRQAAILNAIFETVKARGIVKALGKEAFERGMPILRPEEITFDFNTYPHLWEDYARLPDEIKIFFNPYVTECVQEQVPLGA